MRKKTLEFLGCCDCKTELDLEGTVIRKGDIKSGVLVCRKCNLQFPIAAGRPVVMKSSTIKKWQSPVDEALGLKEYATLDESFSNLSRIGIEKALDLIDRKKTVDSEQGKSIQAIERSVVAAMKYRGSGKWFDCGNRKERHLQFPWKKGDKLDSFNIFMNRILEKQGKSILDVASGGGSGVSHQAFLNSDAEQILAVERDLKCLGNIQYRFKYVEKDSIAEAVGGNIRELPVRSEGIDTAMMLAALPEICGISKLLSEVYRVLKPEGHYIVFVSEQAYTPPAFSSELATRFAEAADLYSGYRKFEGDAEKAGFRIEQSERYVRQSGNFSRLIEFKK